MHIGKLLRNRDVKKFCSLKVTQTGVKPEQSPLLARCFTFSGCHLLPYQQGHPLEPLTLEVWLDPTPPVSMETDSEAGFLGCPFSNFTLRLFWKMFVGTPSQDNPSLWFD